MDTLSQVTDCCFCSEIGEPKPGRIVRQSPHCVALPSVAPLGPGHVLVLPRSHVRSMAQLPRELMPEFLAMASDCADIIAKRFGAPLFFEHGVGRTDEGGCGVD